MTLPSYEACLRYLAEQHRLRCEGRAFIVVTHPCFREESYSSFKTQFNNEDYLQNGASFGVEVSLTGTRRSSSLTTTGIYQPCLSSRAKLDFGC